ncbi:diacylglycerol kinase family protein [Nocardioides sp. AN3]
MAERAHPRESWRPVDPPRRPVLLVNPRSGQGVAARLGLVARARDLGIEVLELTADETVGHLVQRAVGDGADALGMAGGDGSLAVVAAAAAEHDLPFVCVPAGTRNHFALDVGIDRRDVLGSLEAFRHGVERRVDIAFVNGRLFLNNVSLGIYGEAVRSATYRDAKARVLVETAEAVLAPNGEAPALRLVDDREHEHNRPAVVLVSNNPYSLLRPPAGTRPTLAGGTLGVVVLDAPEPGPRQVGRSWSTPSLDVWASETVHAGIDGEAVDLDPPLRFEIRPLALRVRISHRHPGVSPTGIPGPVPRPPRRRPG